MKKKAPAPDIEAMLDAVARDHGFGRPGGKGAVPPLIGVGKKSPAVSGSGRNGLLAALQTAVDSKSPDPAAEDSAPETSPTATVELADEDAGVHPGRERDARQATRLRAEKASLKAELELSMKEKGNLKAELQKAVRQRDAAEKEIQAERTRHETAAHDLFDAWRRTVGLEFESTNRKAEFAGAMAANADAFVLAERALTAQAASNAKYGTVRALREEFDRIERVTEELRFAEKESLYPVPEIRKALAALGARRRKLLEIPEIAGRLGVGDPETVPLLPGAINGLPDGKEALQKIERFQSVAAALKATGLVDGPGHDRLQRLIGDKVRRILRAEASRAAGRPGVREETFEALVRDGGGGGRYSLLVDGNNVLVTNETVYGDGGVIPDFRGKRARLNQALEKIAQAFRHTFAVYDGNEERTESGSERFTVVFTEKKQQVADDWIADHVAAGKKDACILATDDAGLIARCPAVHAVIGSRHLYEFLAGQGVLKR